MFIKTRTKHASKGGIELAVLKSFREVLIEVLSFGFGVAVLVRVLLDVLLLSHSVGYGRERHNDNNTSKCKHKIK